MQAEQYSVPLLVAPGASGDPQGVLRILNATDESGSVEIYAVDDAGTRSGPAAFTLNASAAVEFTATELASGNATLGLTGGIGTAAGDARLEIQSDLDIVPLAFVRALDGTLSAMHDTVRGASAGNGSSVYTYDVPVFNLSTETVQVSRLRLINPGVAAASVTIGGRDDSGATATGGDVTLRLAAGGATTLTAQQLEAGDAVLTGRLGAGVATWRLTVSSDQPLEVVSLVASTAGYWNNLSTTAVRGGAPADHGAFTERFDGRSIVYDTDGGSRTLSPMANERFTETGESDGLTTTYMGDYSYTGIGPDAGRLTLHYDGGDRCAANLYFSSRTGGWFASHCTDSTDADGYRQGGTWFVEEAEQDGYDGTGEIAETTFEVNDALPGVPTSGTFVPNITGGGGLQLTGSGTTVSLNSGAYFELDDGTRYTCTTADGCTIVNGTVTAGTVTGRAADAGEVDRFPSFRMAAAPGNQSYTVGTAIDTLTLPAATGGNGDLTYSLSPNVPGLTFNAPTRQLNGTPATAGTHTMAYTARDEDGDTDTLRFTITVSSDTPAEGSLGVCQVGMRLSSGQSCTYPGTTDEFSVNARGRGTILSFLAGIRIRIDNQTISGRVYDFEASHQGDGVWRIDRIAGSAEVPTNGGGTGTDTSPSFPAGSGPGNQTYTVGTAIDTLTLPEPSGGDGTLTYSLTPPVPGLTFDAMTRQLTGTPSAAGTYDMTYTARDVDGDTDTLRFAITVDDDNVGGEPRAVRLFYLLPSDRPFRQEVVDATKIAIREAHAFFAEQMRAHGHGDRTFRFETDGTGEPLVHRVNLQHPDSYYADGGPRESSDLPATGILFVVEDTSGASAYGGRRRKHRGSANYPANLMLGANAFVTVLHELGHAFGLPHDWRDGSYVMSYGGGPTGRERMSACAADFLSIHPYFNADVQIEETSLPTVDLVSSPAYPAGATSVPVQLQISDPDGLHQVILLSQGGVKACREMNGEQNAIVEFDYDGYISPETDPNRVGTSLSNPLVHTIDVLAVDAAGDIGDLTFNLFDVSTQRDLIGVLEGHGEGVRDGGLRSVTSVSFSPDGAALASASYDNSIKLWDAASRTSVATLDPGELVNAVAFSPDGETLASAGSDGAIKLWDVASRTIVSTLEGHTSPFEGASSSVYSVAFSPDGATLASGGQDGTVKLWDVAARTEVATLVGNLDVGWDVAFSPDGTVLAAGSVDSGGIELWDVATRSMIINYPPGRGPVAFSSDGNTFAFREGYNAVKLWDAQTWKGIATLEGHTSTVLSLSFSPSGTVLSSGSYDGSVMLWDIAARREIGTLIGSGEVGSLSYSPDGTILATGSGDGAIRLWDMSPYVRVTGKDTQPGFPAGSGPGDRTYTVGTTIDPLTLPQANGGDGPLTYSLSPAVPGLTFNATAAVRRLTGTPSSAGTFDMTYRVRDTDGDTDSLTFTIAVQAGSGAQAATFGAGETIASLPSGTWVPDVTSGASFSLSGGVATVRLDEGGYIEEGDYRYTCHSAGGCTIGNGRVTSGTIIQTSVAASPTDDRDALMALFNAADGSNWASNAHWGSDAPLGDWHGVATDDSGRVVSLNLRENQLSGNIPPELGNLTNMTLLDLGLNALSGSIPPELGNLTNLQTLDLAYGDNALSGVIPPELGNLANLRWLRLAGNMLSGIIPPELGQLGSLQRLDLDHNELSGSVPSWLGNLTNLYALDLSGNQLSGSIPPELGNLTNLRSWLYLNDNRLSGPIPAELRELVNLEALSLSANQLSGPIPLELGNLANLRILFLGGNELSGTIPTELGNLIELRRLHLAENQLSGSIPPELGNLANLTYLHLGGTNQFSGCIPDGLRDVADNDISTLDLSYCGDSGTPGGGREMTHGVGDTLTDLPTGTWTPDVTSGGSFSSSGDNVTVRLNNGGYIEEAGYRYTCRNSGGCVIENRLVSSGTIIRTPEGTAPDSGGTGQDTQPSFPVGSGPANQTYTVGTAIDALTLPEGSGGNGPLTYSLSPAVPGLSFNATATVRRLTGAPSSAGTFNMVYRVRDVDGDTDTLRFSINVTDPSPPSGAYTVLEGLRVSAGRVQFGFFSAGGCIRLSNTSVNGVTYTSHSSKWQRSDGAGSPWEDVPGTEQQGGLCAYNPTASGEYRMVAEITIDGTRGNYSSENTITLR